MNPHRSKERVKVALAILSSLAVVSWIDWVTGYDFLFFVFYFVPVAISAWYLGRTLTLTVSAVCGITWVLVDRLSDHQYAHEWNRYWNGFTCFLAFGIAGVVLNGLRRTLQELALALEKLKRSNAEIRELQSQLQVVCAWTKRIKIDGKWIPLDEFITRKLNIPITHGMSPEAIKVFDPDAPSGCE